jgi:hypothetical protein
VTATPEPSVLATRFEVSLLPEGNINRRHFTLYVEWRGGDTWAVTTGFHECLGSDGAWSYESLPSERTDEWIAAHRFDLETALKLAQKAAPGVTVNGWTAAQAYARDVTGVPADGG